MRGLQKAIRQKLADCRIGVGLNASYGECTVPYRTYLSFLPNCLIPIQIAYCIPSTFNMQQ
jgi:hypothetical protein